MTVIMEWIQMYWRELLIGLFFAMQFLFMILLVIAVHRTKVIRRQIDQITSRVGDYLRAVMQEDTNSEDMDLNLSEKQRDEEENQIISTVLKEIFP